jgi:hypothetical protein
MRVLSPFASAAAAGSIALLAACAANLQAPTVVVPAAPHRTASPTWGPNYLYIADITGPNTPPVINVLRKQTYSQVRTVSLPLGDSPIDLFLDSNKNLYVAIHNGPSGPNVTEYAPGQWNAPIFTYNANMQLPLAVTTDANGNVYEGDNSGYINEYQQGNNVPIASCLLPASVAPFGVAVDRHGDVFATTEAIYGSPSEQLVEYPGGLNGCESPTVLPLPQADVGTGIAVDKHANLLIANSGSVEVVDAPTYGTVNRTIGSGFSCAGNVRLNEGNTQALVTDGCNVTVTVVSYPSGTNTAVLGTGNGLTGPQAAVESPNAVY